MLPLSLLKTAVNHPMLVELKNGETYNGHLVNCDNWMNLQLRVSRNKIHRWYPFFGHLNSRKKCPKKGAVSKKGGNCPEKWDVHGKLPKNAKFDRFLRNLSPNSYQDHTVCPYRIENHSTKKPVWVILRHRESETHPFFTGEPPNVMIF